jgi:hypothetical protein
MAALLGASELEEGLSTFRLDSTWKKSCLAFMNAWTTKVMDLDNVLIHLTMERYCTQSSSFHEHFPV